MLGGGFTTFGIKYRRRSSRSWFLGVAALPSASERATATSAWQVGSLRPFIWPRIISRLHFSLTFLTKVKRFSNVFCEVDIALEVQKSHCPLVLCQRGFFSTNLRCYVQFATFLTTQLKRVIGFKLSFLLLFWWEMFKDRPKSCYGIQKQL